MTPISTPTMTPLETPPPEDLPDIDDPEDAGIDRGEMGADGLIRPILDNPGPTPTITPAQLVTPDPATGPDRNYDVQKGIESASQPYPGMNMDLQRFVGLCISQGRLPEGFEINSRENLQTVVNILIDLQILQKDFKLPPER
jgi:hypothetical protein